MDYFNARWYHGALGRFLSADTIVPGPGNPQAFNRYAYSLSNPLKYIDPSRHASICFDCGGGSLEQSLTYFSKYGRHGSTFNNFYAAVYEAETAFANMAAGGLTKTERITLEAHEAAVQSEHQQAVNSLSQANFHRSMVEWGESSLANRAVQLGIENLPDPQSSADIRRLLEFVGGSGVAATVARWKGAEYTLTPHAETQMIERGLTVNQVEMVMRANSPFHYWWEGQLRMGWYDAGSRTFIAVVPNEGIVRTVMTDIQPGYIANLRQRNPWD